MFWGDHPGTRQTRARRRVKPSTPQERLESMERRLAQMVAEGCDEESLKWQRLQITEQRDIFFKK